MLRSLDFAGFWFIEHRWSPLIKATQIFRKILYMKIYQLGFAIEVQVVTSFLTLILTNTGDNTLFISPHRPFCTHFQDFRKLKPVAVSLEILQLCTQQSLYEMIQSPKSLNDGLTSRLHTRDEHSLSSTTANCFAVYRNSRGTRQEQPTV